MELSTHSIGPALGFFRFQQSIALLFIVIFVLANIPFIGTTSPLVRPSCMCPDAVGMGCGQSSGCYYYFSTRQAFWWPWGLAYWDFYGWNKGELSRPLWYSKNQSRFEMAGTSLPLLSGVRNIWLWHKINDIVGLSLSLVYFYVLSCLIVYVHRKYVRKNLI